MTCEKRVVKRRLLHSRVFLLVYSRYNAQHVGLPGIKFCFIGKTVKLVCGSVTWKKGKLLNFFFFKTTLHSLKLLSDHHLQKAINYHI